MEMLIAILLWIGCITAPNTYTQAAIDNYSIINEPVITSVMNNPPQQIDIWQQYGAVVTEVSIVDPFK